MRQLTAFVAGYNRLFPARQHRAICSTATAMTTAMEGREIATHDGAFHCDEVLACHMLRNHTSAYRQAKITRSRDPALLDKADIVVDVGAKYDVSKARFDHHQRGFISTFANDGKRSRTKLSSAGLIYKHFGEEVIDSILHGNGVTDLSKEDLKRVYLKVYDSFVEAVDGIDNGVQMYDCDTPPRYESSTDLGSRVGRLNSDWFEKNPDQDAYFEKALLLVGAEFDECVRGIATSWLPARTIVANAYAKRTEDDPSGSTMVMREFAPWKDHLYTLEEEGVADLEVSKQVLYVVYQDITKASWRIQCVPVRKGSFQSRKPLPELWRGLRDDALSTASGIEQCIFVHTSGFIGGNVNFEGAMALAKKSLKM